MATLMIQDASEDTLATYDTVIRQLEESGLGHPPGRQFHAAARKGNGYLVTDVWESQEALNHFFETLGPLLEETGGRLDPPQIYPVHNLIKDI
jgi:hypothetical protein